MNVLNALIAKLGSLFNWIYTIQPWERAIRVRAGKHIKYINPGIHLRIPLIDAIYKQNIRYRACDAGSQTLTTQCGDTITFSGSIRYRISDVLKMYEKVHAVADTIKQEVMARVTQYVVTNDTKDCTAKAISEHVTTNLDFSQYGFEDVEFFLTDFAMVKTFRLINGDIGS